MQPRICQVIGSCAIVLALVGCETPALDQSASSESGTLSDTIKKGRGPALLPPDAGGVEVPAPKPAAEPQNLALTGFSTITDPWGYVEKAEPPATLTAPAATVPEEFSDTYTRLVIIGADFAKPNNHGAGNGATGDFLRYEPRHPISRYLVGKNYTTNLTAKVVVGSFEATVPLATVTHQSDRTGEHWSRSLHYNALGFPLFLVRAGGAASIPSISFKLNAANEVTSQGAAAGLQAALSIARATGITASVITNLSEQATKERSRAIDDVVSKLFSNGISEEHDTDRDLRLWRSNGAQPDGVAVEFFLPSQEGEWDSAPRSVGRWIFTFDLPRRSIFSDWRICGEIRLPKCTRTRSESEQIILKNVDASAVLNYRLLNTTLGTIRTYLSQQDWYLSSINGMSSSTVSAQVSAGNNMCRKIRNEITGLGLNPFDADIVLWAVWKGMPLPDNKPDPTTLDDCKQPIIAINSKRT